jgi:hypothetical protein
VDKQPRSTGQLPDSFQVHQWHNQPGAVRQAQSRRSRAYAGEENMLVREEMFYLTYLTLIHTRTYTHL